jgi:hypothetical protein
MSAVEKVVAEINALYSRGVEMLEPFLSTDDKQKPGKKKTTKTFVAADLRLKYEPWYTLALGLVQQLTPERAVDFVSAYKNEKRKTITCDTYTISDFLHGLAITDRVTDRPLFSSSTVFIMKCMAQLAILLAAAESAQSLLRDVRTVLRAELFDDDLVAARDLVAKSHLRSAGVISGVVLEGHLKSVAARRTIKFTKKHLAISDLNDGLKNGSIYDIPMWRFIQRLADIRNLCGHSGEREPTRSEVDDLIAGVDKVIKEVF